MSGLTTCLTTYEKAKSRRSAVGSALRSGRKGRGFESRRLDQKMQEIA